MVAGAPSGVRVDTATVSKRMTGGVHVFRGGRTRPRSERCQAGAPETPIFSGRGAGMSAPFSVNRRSMESAIALEADSTWSRESPGRTPLIPDSVRKEKPLSGQYPGSAIALAVVRNPEPQSEPPSDPWVFWPAGAGGRRVRLSELVADLPVRRDRVDQPGGAVDVLPVRRWRALREGGARLLARRFGRPFSPVHVVPDEAARARRDGERGQQCERGRGPDRGTPAHRLSPVRRGP